MDDLSDCRILEYVIEDSKIDRDYDLEGTESVGPVKDLVTIDDAGYESGRNENKWDYLFDPNDKREAYDGQVTERQLAIPSSQLIVHIHPTDE